MDAARGAVGALGKYDGPPRPSILAIRWLDGLGGPSYSLQPPSRTGFVVAGAAPQVLLWNGFTTAIASRRRAAELSEAWRKRIAPAPAAWRIRLALTECDACGDL
jgi:hypothetical protein